MKNNPSKIFWKQRFRQIIHFGLVFLCVFHLSPLIVAADDNVPTIQSFSSLIIEANRGQVLFAQNADEQVQASIASKMMTVLIALETAKPDAMITASNEAANVEGASMHLRIGEKYSVEALVYAVMLNNADDAALTLAEYVGGDIDSFVIKMNETAAKIGMSKTYFTNPTGASNPLQLTTATDIAKFLKIALENASFSRVFGAQAKPWYDDQKTVLMTNHNEMFWSFEGTDGGMATQSGESTLNYVTSVTRNGLQLLLIQLEAPEDVVESEATQLLTTAFDNFRYGTLVSAGQVLKTITVQDQNINLVPSAVVRYVYPVGENFVSDLSINVNDKLLKPPILKTDIIGVATYTLEDGTIIQVDLFPDREWLPEKTRLETFKERLNENKELLYLIGLLSVLELVMVGTKVISGIQMRMKSKRITDDEQQDE